MGLQGQGDRWPVKGCDAKKVSPAVLSGFMCGFQGHYGFGLKVKFHLKYLHVPVCPGTDAQSKCGDVSFQPMQAPRCTMVTSSRRLPEKVRAWLRNSNGLSRSPLRVVVLSILSDLLQPGWQELPPWFWERQNSTRRHSGQARVEQLDHGR